MSGHKTTNKILEVLNRRDPCEQNSKVQPTWFISHFCELRRFVKFGTSLFRWPEDRKTQNKIWGDLPSHFCFANDVGFILRVEIGLRISGWGPGPRKNFPRLFILQKGRKKKSIPGDQNSRFRWRIVWRKNCRNKIELRPTWNYMRRSTGKWFGGTAEYFYSERWVTILWTVSRTEIPRKVTHRPCSRLPRDEMVAPIFLSWELVGQSEQKTQNKVPDDLILSNFGKRMDWLLQRICRSDSEYKISDFGNRKTGIWDLEK